MRIIFITGNEHKLREAKQILSGHEMEGKKLDLLEIQSLDPKAIITEKLKEARAQVDDKEAVIIVEDVSLWIGETGLPGPFIKFFNETIGRDGNVRFARAFGNERARVECNIGLLAAEKEEPVFFTGSVEGKLVDQRGESGFGFDPIFEPDGHEKTFAEMTLEEKNAISHRRKALERVKEFLAGK